MAGTGPEAMRPVRVECRQAEIRRLEWNYEVYWPAVSIVLNELLDTQIRCPFNKVVRPLANRFKPIPTVLQMF